MRFLIFLAILLKGLEAFAQQTIFNVPSADITKKDQIYLQHESQFRVNEKGRFINATNYATYGVGYNTELNLTQFNLSSPVSKNVSVGLGFKSSYLLAVGNSASLYQPKIIFGSMVPFSLQNNGIGNWSYVQGSFYLPQTKTRLSGGMSAGTKQIFGRRANCFMGGFEQKVSENFSLISDWYSGNHALGIFATGFSYAFPRDYIFFGGYQIPNSRKVGYNSVVIEIGKTF